MKRRVISVLLILVFAVSCLAACNGASGDVGGNTEPSESTTTERLSNEEMEWLREMVKSDVDEYEEYLTSLPKGSVENVRRLIEEEAGGYVGEACYYLNVDQEGYLCLCAEIIVYIENPTEEGAGCNIDHKHVFLEERLSGKKVSENKGAYQVIMKNADWLYEDLKSSYKSGETVVVKIKVATDIGYILVANDEKIEEDPWEEGRDWWQFSFTMPDEDVVLEFKTYDGFLQYAKEAELIEAYWLANPEAEFVSVKNYYGEYESGAIVAMMNNSLEVTMATWEENISYFNIRYNNGNRILVLHKGEFFTLTEAYEKGYLTDSDMADIENKQRMFYEYLYADNE